MQNADEFLSVPSHMKSRGWQLGMLFSVPAFFAAVAVVSFLPDWHVIALFLLVLFVPFATAQTAYRAGVRDASVGRDSD